MSTPPERFATNANYGSGPDAGTPTRVDPSSNANGFIRGVVAAAQHVNHLFGLITDYLRDQIETPESFAEIRDDFTGCVFDATTDILHSAFPWQITSTENAVPGTDPLTHPGTVTASLLATEEFEMELAGQQLSIRWGDLQNATVIARVTSTDLTDAEMFVGFAENFELVGVGNNAVGLWLDEATSANWLIRHKVGGVDDATDTTQVVATNAWQTIKITRISSTQVTVTRNGDLVATLTDAVTAPDPNTFLTLGMLAKAGSAAAMTPAVDFLYARWTTANRTT